MSTIQTTLATFSSFLTPCSRKANHILVKDAVCNDQCRELPPQYYYFGESIISSNTFELFLSCLSAPVTVAPPADSNKQKSPAAPSEKEFISYLKKAQCSFLSYSDSNVPWFETLFPDVTLPALVNDQVPKEIYSPLFKRVASKLKSIAREYATNVPSLPSSLAATVQKVILDSVRKSTKDKCPVSIVNKARKAQHYPALSTAQPTTPKSSPSKEKKSSPAPAKLASKPIPKDKAPQNPAKPSIPSTPKVSKPGKSSTPASTQTKASPKKPEVHKSSEIIERLKTSSSPTFYFAADKTPAFESLFPRTTRPPTTLVSGTVRVEPVHFSPLLKSRISSAHAFLRKNNFNVQRLPAAFMKYQTRLITRSIEQSYKDRKAKTNSKKVKAKQSKAKAIVYVPASSETKAKLSQAQQAVDPDTEDVTSIRRNHVIKALIDQVRNQQVNPDPRLLPRIASFYKVLVPYSDNNVPLSQFTYPGIDKKHVTHDQIVAVPSFTDGKLTQLQFVSTFHVQGKPHPNSTIRSTLNQASLVSFQSQASSFYETLFTDSF